MTSSGLLKTSISLLVAVNTITATTPAHADPSPVTCSPSKVYWDAGSAQSHGGYLNIQCVEDPNNWYYAGSVCSPTSIDTLKAWLSLAQAAELSGKTLTITYDAAQCNGCWPILRMQLDK